jgi:hypothetical protein
MRPTKVTHHATFLFILIFIVCACLAGVAQQNPQRLILKDGSFQTVTKYEVQGQRVRYYSAERYSWEELPSDMVDWPATDKFNKDRDAIRTQEVLKAVAPTVADEPEPAMVAPGLYLPDGGGVFLMDTYQTHPELVELTQSGGELNKHMGKNILRAAINPLALSSKQTIELKGDRSKTQSHVPQPSIYVSVEQSPDQNSNQSRNQNQNPSQNKDAASALDQASSGPGRAPKPKPTVAPQNDKYRIVRMEKKKDVRVVGDLNVAIYGKVSQKQNWVKTVTESAGGDWVKITPTEPLTPGEYALVELLDKGQINLYVWDFGVDSSAPENSGAWKSRTVQPGEENKAPELEKRPPIS